ncbi:MAG: TM0106 family RecB-like putative nuclease [Polyangiaceae bacterium]|nr:TM0106 family RecB-like putative nuclease [Polyangiaceae bacterium]
MRIQQGKAGFSATDLANHLGCRHLTVLDLRAAQGTLSPPTWRDPALQVLQQRGFEHETQYLESLREQGLHVCTAAADGPESGADATLAAMQSGADVIAQATLRDGDWFGRADVLRRVSGESDLGEWSYEVVDTKLARETRAGTILQLCLYSDMVGRYQGRLPERMYVVSPGTSFIPQSYRVQDYLAYFRLVRTRLTEAVGGYLENQFEFTYPEPVPQCDICRWWSACDQHRRADDHLSLVAGISRLQRRELVTWGVQTLSELAVLPLPLGRKPSRGSSNGFIRVREQARVQLQGRAENRPVYELLPRAPERGLARLPMPSAGDVFFDIEGDPFVGNGGLEYLLGWVVVEDGGTVYRSQWAVNATEERRAFETFIDEVMERWSRHRNLHIYHYAPYEPGALKRLMGRYATREDEVDRLLRGGVFVDLYSIARQSVRASVERYSIKNLEQFYGYCREVELKEASKIKRAFERALELGQVAATQEATRVVVETYNRDDCVSALELRDWLEKLRNDIVRTGEDLARPEVADGAPSESIDERQQRVRDLTARLLMDVPADREVRSNEAHATWLLANMLGWHRREEKAPWWDFFRLASLGEVELIDEDLAVAGLEFLQEVGGTVRCPIHRYRFEPQETKLGPGDDLHLPGGEPLGSVSEVNMLRRTIDIKKRSERASLHPTSVFSHSIVGAREQADALFRLGQWVADNGIDSPGPHRAARDLLLARSPRLNPASQGDAALQRGGEDTITAARRLAACLDAGVLPLQGPPGAGKTYTGARMICELVRAGKKVGITAMSHKVICNLLDGVVDAAGAERLSVSGIQKVSGKASKDAESTVRETNKNQDVLEALQSGAAQIAAGTAWLWAREEMFEAVDVLFVDEAGQMSLANVLAVAQAARSLVLLGDPQQLEQPILGSHPEGTEVSALQHLLGGAKTIPSDRGLFLPETWRLHPHICALTSELFYENRLRSRPELHRQALHGDGVFAGAGLWFVPVEHEGNRNSSSEEADVIVELHERLTSGACSWTDSAGTSRPLSSNDILIVAPYNAHVGTIGERLPDARVGTVDKFQGQEAPVVIYSMATSSPEDAPRGMEFLFSLHRLNVASSRARCACILVASPRLFEPDCTTPGQMQLANAFCRYLEIAQNGG